MVKINLLPLKIKKTNIALRLYTYVVIGSSVLVLCLALGLVNLVAQAKKAERQTTLLESKRKEISELVEPIRAILLQEQENKKVEKLLYQLALQQSTWVRILDSLATQVSQDLWLDHLVVASVPETTARMLTVTGRAYHKISVADFLANLEKAEIFSNVKLEALNDLEEDQSTLVQFKVSLNCSEVWTVQSGGAE